MATFTGTAGADVADASTGTLTGFTGGTEAALQDGIGDTFIGLGGNDTIVAGSGHDILDGGPGNDVMQGGAGDDLYGVDADGDIVIENPGNGTTDMVVTTVTYTLPTNVENLDMDGSSPINGTGNAENNAMFGNEAANILSGVNGNDSLSGNGGHDRLVGGSGNDALNGGTGNDTLEGGAGNDLYFVDSSGDVVTESANQGIDTVQSSITYTLKTNFENLVLTGSDPIDGTGTSQANTITGNDSANTLSGVGGNDTLIGDGGNDRLTGGAGNDAMFGGAGDDLYEVDNSDDTVTENSGQGTDTVRSAVTYALSSNVEHLFLTGTLATNGTGNGENNSITGNAAANTLNGLDGNDQLSGQGGDDILLGGIGNDRLIGAAGNDSLDGGTGNDVMQGGLDDDSYIVDSLSDQILESANQGLDQVQASSSYVLPNNVDFLFLTGTDNTFGVGNSLDNFMAGNSGNNALLGEGGNDNLNGGNGNDELNGGPGFDLLSGGPGNDIYSYFTAAEGGDTIFPFVPIDDTFAFSSVGFGGGLTPGETLVAGTTFIANTNPAPTTTEGTFLYDTDHFRVSWDADGIGSGGAVLIAQFASVTALTTADFLIV